MTAIIKNIMDTSQYGRMELRQHILHRPDTWAGSKSRQVHDEAIFNPETGHLDIKSVDIPMVVRSVMREIVSNAADNVPRSIRYGFDTGIIAVTITPTTVTVYNEGCPIPADYKVFDFKTNQSEFIPYAQFGELLTGSNLEDQRVLEGAGRNGLGAKITNVFSKLFKVTGYDHTRRVWYELVWTNNMERCVSQDIRHFNGISWVTPQGATTTAPVMTRPDGCPPAQHHYSMVCVSFDLDFAHLGYQGQYDRDTYYMLMGMLVEYSFTTKVPFYCNGALFDYSKPTTFFEAVFCPPVEVHPITGAKALGSYKLKDYSHLIHYEWPANVQLIDGPHGTKTAADPRQRPVMEVVIAYTPNHGRCMSYINCQETSQGGVHVDALFEALAAVLRAGVKSFMKKDNDRTVVSVADIRQHVTVIINAYAANVQYSSQTKERATSPVMKVLFSDKEAEAVCKWDLVAMLVRTIKYRKMLNSAGATTNKRRKNIAKAEQSNTLDRTPPQQQVCAFMEGDSAMGYAVSAIKFIPGGRDYMTLYPWRGKILNVTKADDSTILANEEIQEFIELMGFQYGRDYRNPDDFATLRIGNILWMTDADPDGDHIKGLGLNVIARMFPTFFISPFAKIMFYQSPLVRIGKLSFFSVEEAQQYAEQNGLKNVKMRYMKGLGSSNKEDIALDFQRPVYTQVVYDQQAPELLRLAFDKMDKETLRIASGGTGQIMSRKDWLLTAAPAPIHPATPVINFSAWINSAIRAYFVYTFKRAIPDFDGLNDAQRKILYVALMHNITHMKTANLASRVSDATHYPHGEKSMTDCITNLAQDFVGSNNLNYLIPDGQFGTRNFMGGDAADGRYTHTGIMSYMKHMVDMEYLPHVPRIIRGDEECEATHIPFVIAPYPNGAKGIAGGWSTTIPNYNPRDLAALTRYYVMALAGHASTDEPAAIPYYRGFTGMIQMVDNISDHDDVLYVDENGLPMIEYSRMMNRMVAEQRYCKGIRTYGMFRVLSVDDKGAEVEITELPIGMPTHQYKEWLDDIVNVRNGKKAEDVTKRVQHGITISRYTNYSDDTKVHFILHNLSLVVSEMTEKQTKVKKGAVQTAGVVNSVLTEKRVATANITHENLWLTTSIGLTNMHLLNPDGVPVRFDSIQSIVKNFVQRRYPDYVKLMDIRRANLKGRIDTMNVKLRYLRACLDEVIVFPAKANKAQQLEILTKHGFPEAMLKTKQYEICEEEYSILYNKYQALMAEYERECNTHPATVWLQKIDALIPLLPQ